MVSYNMEKFDIIGDIHGHAAALEKLLEKLGYQKQPDCYRHPQRKAVFVGDFIDRGPENFKTMAIVKAMTDNNQALAIMGNHEFNALCFHTRGPGGLYLRPHIQKNVTQHKEVLEEIREKGETLWQNYLEWFRRMPLFIEKEGFRVVHACWDQKCIDFLKNTQTRDREGRLTDKFLRRASQKGTETYHAVEVLLKGKEILLPRDHPGIYDKDGHLRKKIRVRWWLTRAQRETAETYDHVTRIDETNLKKLSTIKIPADIREELQKGGGFGEAPVFIGHYWFTGTPRPLMGNVACLDYSVGKGGELVCYRWDGEQVLLPEKFVRI
ncbi:MAG: hypothetical protein GY950_24885 [bacterium]|nr:hypothetical protein [bacterium]